MLPHAYELPAAIVLAIGGTLACFAGYRLFKLVLALYGFILGAMLASSMFGISNTIRMIAAAVVGGIAGALILVFAYFVGIALVGARRGALPRRVDSLSDAGSRTGLDAARLDRAGIARHRSAVGNHREKEVGT